MTTRPIFLGLLIGALAARSAAGAPPADEQEKLFRTSEVHFQNADGQPIGEAILRETPSGVLITANLRDLPPGEHGFHVHEHGACLAPFKRAGGHFNPGRKSHGFENPQGPHAGDLPNIIVPEGGSVEVEVLAPRLALESGKPRSLMDDDGAALVVHSGPDDYSTDPAGDSGARIACGIVERPRTTANVPRGALQVPPPADTRTGSR